VILGTRYTNTRQIGTARHWLYALSGDSSMPTPSIPWPVFFKALRMQRSTLVHAWLRYWIFSDAGAALIPKRGDGRGESLSLEEKQKKALLFLMALERGQRTLR
jgi:hypothetical protein